METPKHNDPEGLLIIISAPSGAGKSTLTHRLLRHDGRCHMSVSHTTRAPRTGEEEGTDYFFVSPNNFDAMIADGAFLEWAEVHGHRYGTSKEAVGRQRLTGKDVILEIDVSGHAQVKRIMPHAVSIFVMPPSIDELRRRLIHRAKDSEETIALRLQNARNEMEQFEQYDYVVVNRDLERCFDELWSIIKAERCRTARFKEYGRRTG